MMNRQSETGPARFCVTNAKGGTGKTTVAINVAGALNDRGRDVLFIDLDPQATPRKAWASSRRTTPTRRRCSTH